MKKNFKKLVLNKSTLSNLESNEIVGGDQTTKLYTIVPPSGVISETKTKDYKVCNYTQGC